MCVGVVVGGVVGWGSIDPGVQEQQHRLHLKFCNTFITQLASDAERKELFDAFVERLKVGCDE